MKEFTGESASNDIQEALQNAIETAKKELLTDWVDWKLESIKGNDGGIALVHNLFVTISAKAYA